MKRTSLTIALISSIYGHTVLAANLPNNCNSMSQGEVSSFSDFSKIVNSSTCPTPGQPQKLCIVYDMDNTILTQDPTLGGDAWSSWQTSLASNDPSKVSNWGAAGSNWHAFEGSMRYFMNYRPTEPDTLTIINQIKTTYPSMVLTARDFEHYYSSTAQSLAYNKFDFTTNPVPDPTPEDTSNTLLLTKNSTGEFYKAYNEGVYYSASDNKGTELLQFLTKVRAIHPDTCSEVIFLDNSQTNVNNVYAAFANQQAIGLVALRYTAYDKYLTPTPEMIARWTLGNPASPANSFYEFMQMVNKSQQPATSGTLRRFW